MKMAMLIAAGALFFSCSNMKNKNTQVKQENGGEKVVAATLGDVTQESDPVTITGATVDGNTLKIDVSYSGGCKEHIFDLVGSFAIMKSLPAQRSIKLLHNSKDDTCREFIEQTVEFDISELAYSKEAGSEIILLLNGYREPITYKYQ